MIEFEFAGENGHTENKAIMTRAAIGMRVGINLSRENLINAFVADCLLNQKMTIEQVKDIYPSRYEEFLELNALTKDDEDIVDDIADIMYIGGLVANHNLWCQLDEIAKEENLEVSAGTPAANN